MGEPEPTLLVTVNGRPTEVAVGTTLLALIDRMELDRRFLVVEHNGVPLAVDTAETVVLSAGDRLELVRPVAGG